MDIETIRERASELFPAAVRFAVARPQQANSAYDLLHQLCAENYELQGFSCHADFFAEIAPKSHGILSLEAWSVARIPVSGWDVEVTMRPFYLGGTFVHFEIRHDGPLPGLTETGYRSHFASLSTFGRLSPEEFLAEIIPERPRAHQLTLF